MTGRVGSTSVSATTLRRERRRDRQRLRAIVNSQGRNMTGRSSRPQGAVRGDEGVLERVLGLVGGAEQVPAERQQGPVMAVVERLEGAVVAGAHARHQSLIR